MNRTLRGFATPAFLVLALAMTALPPEASAASKMKVVDMKDFFERGNPLSYTPFRAEGATVETTIRHQLFFSDLEGNNSGWSVVNFRAGQPNAWHLATGGAHACVGTSWWCGVTGLAHGDGYDNNWVQSLKTVTPITLTGTTNNKLTFKYKAQTEFEFDWCWVLIKSAGASAHYDTLASFTGDFGTACSNASVDIPDSFTTVAQPVELRFLFGSDHTFSAGDSTGAFTGWSIDDVKITAQGNDTRFFDDMEGGSGSWLAESPDPGSLWHIESGPGTSTPASCFFLSTNVWVPFAGSGFGLVPNFCDAMLVTPPMDLTGVFSPNTPGHVLRLQFDDWVNLPYDNFLFWGLYVSGSVDGVTWTPWANPYDGLVFSGGSPQCTELQPDHKDFDPWITSITGILPGTPYLRLGFRIRDERPTFPYDGALRINYLTEGIYFDNIGVYHVYTISGVETVSSVPAGARAGIRKIFPNPFNPRTTIEFSVPTAGPVAVRIFDIHGKEVATVADASMGPGVYRTHWDGRDSRGADASSGVYFAQVQSRDGRDTSRLMLLK